MTRRGLLAMAGAAGVLRGLGVATPAAARGDAPDPAVVGRWDPPIDGPPRNVAIHAVLLRTGRVLLFSGKPLATVWDPATGGMVQTDAPEWVFCAGQAVLPDGRVLVVGGQIEDVAQGGPPYVYTFDPDTLGWTRHQDMRRGRYYPTVTVLADGRALITNGKTEEGGHSFNDDLEVFDPATGAVELVGHRLLGMYAHQFVLPDERVLIAGPGRRDAVVVDPSGWTTTDLPPLAADRTHAGAVLLPGGPDGSWGVMVVGGDLRSTTEVVDARRPGDGWRPGPRLGSERAYMNVVILPDGSLLGVGGAGGGDGVPAAAGADAAWCDLTPTGTATAGAAAPVTGERRALLLEPGATQWRRVASQSEIRAYHSTALLLPDGRVLSAGGTGEGAGLDRLELYSPPYLFRGPRPVVTSAPPAATYGGPLRIGTAGPVARVVLVRPGATTHTNDMDQRHVELAFRPKDGGVVATAPPGPGVAPPGAYLLFVLDAAGVPSVASWVQVS